ncbi:MAG: hypothetical protein WB709_07995 [Solirubrobacteraceae bacterium]
MTEPLIGSRPAPPRARISLTRRSSLPVALVAVVAAALALAALVVVIAAGRPIFESQAPSPSVAARDRPVLHADLSALPAAARGVVSGAIGADSPAYRVGRSRAGLQAANPDQRMRMRFGSAGVQIQSGGLRLGIDLQGVGNGRSSRPVGATVPSARANLVTYARTGLREWYRNGPLGLEQGFTVLHPPNGRFAGSLTLAMGLSGDLQATLSPDGRSVVLGRTGEALLRYGDLVASDARGRTLHSWLALRAHTLQLRVDTRGANYPLRIDPLIQRGGKLTASQEEGKGEFGARVALSANGSTALIAAPYDDGGKGAVRVFGLSGSTWVQQAKLTGAGEAKEEFGYGVALSADGNTAAVGSPGANGNKGAATVFRHTGTKWNSASDLTATEENDEGRFGAAMAFSADASTLLIGEPRHHTSTGGAVWAFLREGPPASAFYAHQGSELNVEVGPIEGTLGESLALSADGNTALIGSPGSNIQQGWAYVFTRSEGVWAFSQGLSGEGEVGEPGQFGGLGEFRFGESVALSADGSTALIGGSEDNDRVGAVWTFVRSGTTWTQQGEKLTAGGEVGEGAFGTSVALSSDGDTALVGAPADNVVGAAWVYKRSGSGWVQEGNRLTGSGESGAGHFGASVALSADGTVALLGGPFDDQEQGAAWAFVHASVPSLATGAASGVTAGAATLNGTVNPNGVSSTAYFQYGSTAAYGQATGGQGVGSAESAGSITAALTGLAPETTYHYRVIAESSAGLSYGGDQTFRTALSTSTPVAPINKAPPTILGTPIRGQALSVSPGSWSNNPTSFAYQWQGCDLAGSHCTTLAGAIGPTHNLTQGDVGRRLRAVVTAGNAGGSSSAVSTISPVIGSQVESAMTWTFGWSRRFTVVQSLIVHEIPAGGAVVVTCHGQGCPFARAHPARTNGHVRCGGRTCKHATPAPARATLNLTRLFKNRHLGVGARIMVQILKTGWIGKSYLFTTRANHAPSFHVSCLAPGSTRPGHGC